MCFPNKEAAKKHVLSFEHSTGIQITFIKVRRDCLVARCARPAPQSTLLTRTTHLLLACAAATPPTETTPLREADATPAGHTTPPAAPPATAATPGGGIAPAHKGPKPLVVNYSSSFRISIYLHKKGPNAGQWVVSNFVPHNCKPTATQVRRDPSFRWFLCSYFFAKHSLYLDEL
jgi:hypothetical protein